MKVYIDDHEVAGARKIVDVEVLEDRKASLIVKLSNGNIIKRKKNRDLVKEG